MAEDHGTPSRRSARPKKLSLKALENVYEINTPPSDSAKLKTRENRKSKAKTNEPNNSTSSDESEFSANITENSNVLHENEFGGDKIFTFPSRKTREGMLQKASQIQDQIPKTPHGQRTKIKQKIAAKIAQDDNLSDQDFSDSGSEYQAEETSSSNNSSTTEDEPNSSSDSETQTSNQTKFALKKQKLTTSKTTKPGKSRNQNYTIQTDNYFSNHSSNKIHTSNHTLDQLETPRLMQHQLQVHLKSLTLSAEHTKLVNALNASNSNYFEKWLQLMNEGYNVLLYGLGSKKCVLNAFHAECLGSRPVIVVNGFSPSLTIKAVLDAVILQLFELGENPTNLFDALDLIEKEFSFVPNQHLYLLVHNIDSMRSGKTQSIFSKLASIKNVHLVASIDHINAPLSKIKRHIKWNLSVIFGETIWDHQKLSKLNFTWWDVTSFQSYFDETSFKSSMMVQQAGSLALSSLRNVFHSLTSNSKGIYLTLVKYQLEHGHNQYYQGFTFKDLYSTCREAFLVSSDLALRAQLNEFVDHKMVKYKRSSDGTENLVIPTKNTILQQFMNEHTS